MLKPLKPYLVWLVTSKNSVGGWRGYSVDWSTRCLAGETSGSRIPAASSLNYGHPRKLLGTLPPQRCLRMMYNIKLEKYIKYFAEHVR